MQTLPRVGADATDTTPVVEGALTRHGYVLTGWYAGDDLDTIYTGTYTMPVSGVTLKARWTPLAQIYYVYHIKIHGDGTQELVEYHLDRTGLSGAFAMESARTYAGYTVLGDGEVV